VHDYRAGSTPRVAPRTATSAPPATRTSRRSSPGLCGPRPTPTRAVADLLARAQVAFFGIPVRRGVDIPAAIDAATDRANLFAVWQRLWRDGCGADDAAGRQCRGAAVLAALQYRLAEERGFDESAIGWREQACPG
jgi:hypothetical protein